VFLDWERGLWNGQLRVKSVALFFTTMHNDAQLIYANVTHIIFPLHPPTWYLESLDHYKYTPNKGVHLFLVMLFN